MKRSRTESITTFLIALALVVGLCATGSFAQTSQNDSPEARQRRETFELVWQTVNKNFYDPNFNGIDWKAAHDRYAPQVERASSDAELYSLLQLMINELRQSHFWIIPPEAIPKLRSKDTTGNDPDDAGEEGDEESAKNTEPETPLDLIKENLADRLSTGIGIDVRVVNGVVVITRVEAGSAAARAGLRPGFVIKSVDGKSLAAAVAALQRDPVLRDIIQAEIPLVLMANYINGDVSEIVHLTFVDARNVQRRVRIPREKLKGEMSPAIGNLPPFYTEFEAKRLPGGFGYIRFNAFVPSLMKKVCAALRNMHDAPGLIIDLRGNQGGLMGMVGGLGGLVQNYSSLLGVMKMRSGQTPIMIVPQRVPYTGALAILIDGSTQSAAEVFAAGMQQTNRAVIVGEVSAGNTLPSGIIKLPTGALFQYAFGNYQTSEGEFLEGRGVIPDHTVKLNRRALLRSGDPQLAAAIAQLRERISPPRLKELITTATLLDDPQPKPTPEPPAIVSVEAPPPPPKASPKPTEVPGDPTRSPEENERLASQIVNRYIAAIGGESAVLKIKNHVATGTVELPLGLNGTVEIYEEAPNRSSVIMNLKGFGVMQQTFDGKVRWMQDPVSGYVKISEGTLTEDTFHRELSLLRQVRSLRYEGKQKVGDTDCFVLVQIAGEKVFTRLYFDIVTGLLVRQGDMYLEDYRELNGVKMPFVARQETTGGASTVVRLNEVRHNVVIDESKFAERSDCFTKPGQNSRNEK